MIRCVSCGEEYEDDEVIYNCKKCGSVLEVEVEVDVPKSTFEGRRDNLWKYKECLPVDASKRVSLDEGGTPFCRCEKLGKELGIDLYVKVEGSNPTGSFKDRGMTIGMTKAMMLGVDTVGCASTGNTSASLAAYAARAGLRCAVFLPAGKVALGKLAQAMFHGAEVFSINGNFNPFRLEGQKTIGYEIVHDLGWESPDRIVLPVGNAGNISAIWKGITEFHNAGFMDDVPMMTGIQAEGACPIANAFRDKTMDMTPVENPETIATAIRIGAPVSAVKALRAIYDSNGLAETVTDEEILDAQKLLARTEGVGVEPASAASIAGLKKLVEQGDIDKGERVVCVVTGHLLKDPNTAIDACVDPVQVDADIDKIKEILLNK